MRVLLVGAGAFGASHGRAIDAAEGVELAGVVDSDASRAQQLADAFQVPFWTSIGRGASGSGSDIAAIVVPTRHHVGTAVEAIEAGLHVLVEKPVALDLAGVAHVEQVAHSQSRTIDIVSQRRYQSGIYAAWQMVRGGALGKITTAHCESNVWRDSSYFRSAPWRGDRSLGGGNLLNQGMHALDLLLWFLGDPIRATAFQRKSRFPGVKIEELLVGTIEFEGALASIQASLVARSGPGFLLSITGERGFLNIDSDQVILEYQRADSTEPARRTWAATDVVAALTRQYEHLPAIMSNTQPHRVGLRSGALALATGQALLASADGQGASTFIQLPHS